MLAAAKEKWGQHGSWLPFLATCGVAARTAQRLMRYARAVDAGQVEARGSVTETLAALSAKASPVTHLPVTTVAKLEARRAVLEGRLVAADEEVSNIKAHIAVLQAHLGHRSEVVLEARVTAQTIRGLRAAIAQTTEENGRLKWRLKQAGARR